MTEYEVMICARGCSTKYGPYKEYYIRKYCFNKLYTSYFAEVYPDGRLVIAGFYPGTPTNVDLKSTQIAITMYQFIGDRIRTPGAEE